jgi:hypothetical protein
MSDSYLVKAPVPAQRQGQISKQNRLSARTDRVGNQLVDNSPKPFVGVLDK